VLLAVNMGPGLSSHTMASLEQLAGESFAVVTYDQRGTSRSSEPSGGYELLKYVADLEAVRQAVGAERVHLFGHCWGGLVAVLNLPVLFLWGADDPFGLETAQATRDAFSAAQVEFVVIEECGHLWQECPDDFFSHVRAFLDHAPAD